MPKLEVKSVDIKKKLDFANVYNVIGTIDGQFENGEMTTKEQYAPKVGDTIEIEIETTQYGKKFTRPKKENSFVPRSGGDFKPSPANEIPYLSLKLAVEYASAKPAMGVDKVLDFAGQFAAYMKQQGAPAPIEQPRSATRVVQDSLDVFSDDPGPEVPF